MAEREITPIVMSAARGLTATASKMDTTDWTSFSSDDNCFVDLNDTDQINDASKLILIVRADSNSTGAALEVLSSTKMLYTGSGITDIVIGLCDSAAAISELTTGGAISFIGGLESARFKDTDGYLNFQKSTADADTSPYYAMAIIVP